MMDEQREALRLRNLAAMDLAAACLAVIRHPTAAALARSFHVDPNPTPEQRALLLKLEG